MTSPEEVSGCVGRYSGAAVVLHYAGDETVKADDDEQGHRNVVEPLEPLEARAGRGQHDDAPDDGAHRDKAGGGLHAQQWRYHGREGLSAGRGLYARTSRCRRWQSACL